MSKYEFTGGWGHSPSYAGKQELTAWEAAADHRSVLTGMLNEAARQLAKPSLCVWGAGHCNDIDLQQLLDRFDEVHLVDIDAQALKEGVEKQGCTGRTGLHLHGSVDLSGVHDLLLDYQKSATPEKFRQIVEKAMQHKIDGLGQFDVVASTCVLSQIILGIVDSIGEDHEQFAVPMLTIRNRHIELMLQHLNAGGSGVLVTDVTSSDTLPAITEPSNDIQRLLVHAIQQRNHFHGVNPFAIQNVLRTQEPFKSQIVSLELAVPWVWNAKTRHYACVAFHLRKAI